MAAQHFLIKGRVQGVGFRYSMVAAAEGLGITGWVRNCSNGDVEAVVEGNPAQLRKIYEWTVNGPPMAEVEAVEVSDATGGFSSFSIRF